MNGFIQIKYLFVALLTVPIRFGSVTHGKVSQLKQYCDEVSEVLTQMLKYTKAMLVTIVFLDAVCEK